MCKKNIFWLVLVVILIVFIPLFIIGGDFAGSDAQAEDLIMSINPTYKPWFENIFPPLGGEMETFLFSLQAAIGAGIVGYIIGNIKGKRYAKNIK
ncbi:MAG: energy-coupling factor ABC transporter substrate-binding protein [Cetobacterium sp.]|uniref:energy-coupling factor ABC transporter substrate-binding protein n=1 Tax=Cetobacterium sp. TaxID=2071632 RepID=UPI003F40F54D